MRAGDVLDVSQSGIRVSRSTELPVKVGQEFAFELTVPEGKLLVLGKLIRTIKSRGRVHEYGIEWVKHDERLAAAVGAMGAMWRTTRRSGRTLSERVRANNATHTARAGRPGRERFYVMEFAERRFS